MADIERGLRTEAMTRLQPFFDLWEEVPVVLLSHLGGRIDIVARPVEPALRDLLLAFEVKVTHSPTTRLAYRIKQAADYVGARPVTIEGVIGATFVWLVEHAECAGDEVHRLRAMQDVAHQFRVGFVLSDRFGKFSCWLGPNTPFRERGYADRDYQPWAGKAREWLLATRQSGGVRRPL